MQLFINFTYIYATRIYIYIVWVRIPVRQSLNMRERETFYIFRLTVLGEQIFFCAALFPILRGKEPSDALGLHLCSPQPWHLWHSYKKTDLLEVSFIIKILRWQIYGLTFEPKECDYYSYTLWTFCSKRKFNKNVTPDIYVMYKVSKQERTLFRCPVDHRCWKHVFQRWYSEAGIG